MTSMSTPEVAPEVVGEENNFKNSFMSGEFLIPETIASTQILGPEEYLNEIQSRFGYVIPEANLQAMREISVVCIGLGVMGRTMEELARYGVSNFVVVDVPGEIGGVEVSNLNRQVGSFRDTAEYRTAEAHERIGGRPKAEVVARAVLDINPHAKVHAISKMLTSNEVGFLMTQADVAFWGHDDPVGVMDLLEGARIAGIPVFSGLDLASNAYVRIILNDTSSRGMPVLNGAITMEEAEKLKVAPAGKLTFLAKSAGIPIEQMIPLELIQNLVAILQGKTRILSQVPSAVGAFAEQTAFRLAMVAPEVKAKNLDKKALDRIGLKQDVFFRNWERNFGLIQRLKREAIRLAYLSNRQLQQVLGYERGLGPIRYTNMVVRGLMSALIGR